MKFRLFLISLSLLFISKNNYGQCTVDFSSPSSVCQLQDITLEATESGLESYFWDFCANGLSDNIQPNNIGNLSGASFLLGMEHIFDGTNWFGFASSFNSLLFRMSYGSSILNTPTIENLGNVDGVLSNPSPIVIRQEGGNWYAVIHNSQNQTLVRLDFGNSLSNTPTAQVILNNIGVFASTMDMGVSQGNIVLVIGNAGTSRNITTVNLGNSITNIPEAGDIQTSAAIPGVSTLNHITLFQDCNEWFGVITDLARNVRLVDFGTSLLNPPTNSRELTGNIYGTQTTRRAEMFKDGDQIHCLVTTNNNLFRVDVNSDLTMNSFEDLGSFAGLTSNFNLNVINENSDHHVLISGSGTRNLFRITFQDDCPANTPTLSGQMINGVQYSSAGDYNISLRAQYANGDQTIVNRSITVTDDVAPDIDFTSDNICVNNPVDFSSINISGDINNFNWDFGDTNTSNAANPSHTYSAPGDYEIVLNVDNATGCTNEIIRTITIFEEPVPTFDVPSGPICTNQSVFIENTTTGSFGGNISYEWQVNGLTQATTTDLSNLVFVTTGPQEIKLIATIPGCSVEAVQIITNVSEGPTPEFNVNDDCVGTLMQFNNTSTGQIATQQWDFGNGFTSNLENPLFEYSEPGTYEVSLTVANADGCEVIVSEFITVYELPQVQFTNELSCEQSPTQFIDQTTVGDANLTSWSWNFDDPASGNNTSIARDPLHNFSTSGDFNVKLITTSTFGCIDSVEQTVSVLAAPQVDFSFDRTCVGVPVQFQDLSVPPGNSTITSWAWDLGGAFSDQQNPEFTFDVPADYRISLIVTSDNLCNSSFEKTITVAAPPNVSFGQEFVCINEPVHLFDLTEITNDQIVAWNWDFDGLGQSTDSSTFFMFPEGGEYQVTLSVVTNNGCDYSTVQTVEVNDVPAAGFSTDFTLGSPPLTIQFANESNGATDFLWDFDNGNTSTEENPTQVFEELGEFDIDLIAINEAGCRDTTTQRISVLFPELEIDLQRVSLISDGQTNNIVLTITNNGTIFLDSINAEIDLGNAVIVNETIVTEISPGQTINHTLNLTLGRNRLEFICVTLSSFIPNIEDANLTNNNKCEGFEPDALILDPFPNPVQGEFILTVISKSVQPLNLQLISNQGTRAKNIDVNLNEGFNQVLVDVADLNNGLYIMTSETGAVSNAVRVMIIN